MLELALDNEEPIESGNEADGEADTQSLDQHDEGMPDQEINGLFQNFSLVAFQLLLNAWSSSWSSCFIIWTLSVLQLPCLISSLGYLGDPEKSDFFKTHQNFTMLPIKYLFICISIKDLINLQHIAKSLRGRDSVGITKLRGLKHTPKSQYMNIKLSIPYPLTRPIHCEPVWWKHPRLSAPADPAPANSPVTKIKQKPAPGMAKISLVRKHSTRNRSARCKFLGHKSCKPRCEKVFQSSPAVQFVANFGIRN